MIKAVIFDCFGVITKEGWLPFRNKYFATDPAKMSQARDIMSASGNGYISHEEFIVQEAELAGITAAQARAEIEDNPPNDSLLKFIMEELGDYKVGLLSNVSENRLSHFITDEQMQRFDAICLSFEMGVSKPNLKAYEIVADKLGVSLEECVFTDDRLEFCEAATFAGMKALVFTTTEKFIQDFRALEAAATIDN